jgi:hypothetical protein
MHGLLKRPGYRLCSPDSPEAGTLLAEQGLGPADLNRALARVIEQVFTASVNRLKRSPRFMSPAPISSIWPLKGSAMPLT